MAKKKPNPASGSFEVDLVPDPRVLQALAHTALSHKDALSELIDNAIDSFKQASNEGIPVDHPIVSVQVPMPAEFKRDEGLIVVQDNGPGMTPEQAEKALKAGYSGKTKFDNLGLFGLGFNIASAKMGRKTRVLSARKDDDHAIEIIIDLPAMTEQGDYKRTGRIIQKPPGFVSGTIIAVYDWWPEGHANHDFTKRLCQIPKPKFREQIGRRYSTLLRKGIRIDLNKEKCVPFEHCVWSEERSVQHRKFGPIPAQFQIDEIIGHQTVCNDCGHRLLSDEKKCPTCKDSAIRTIEKRIRGWVGIQRYDDRNLFGIDLIRNGRVIRQQEQDAFFTWVDSDTGERIRDYPIDQPEGRIVGEIHLDHVPVDFIKQDFERASLEWIEAMGFLRGGSSLQPTRPGADSNESPIFKLFQGYRITRPPGKKTMVMGEMGPNGKAKRMANQREIEKEYLAKFNDKTPGYYDDAEWWKLVEQADTPPITPLPLCPKCTSQNLETEEVCTSCGEVLIGKECRNKDCDEIIPKSATSCATCGESQVDRPKGRWICGNCQTSNEAAYVKCKKCGVSQGTESPLSLERLVKASKVSSELSIPDCSLRLADDSTSPSIEVNVRYMENELKNSAGSSIPVYCDKGVGAINVFIDPNHQAFKWAQMAPEYFIVIEIADYIYVRHQDLTSAHKGTHTLSNLIWQLFEKYYRDHIVNDPDDLRRQIKDLFEEIKTELADCSEEESETLFQELNEEEQNYFVTKMREDGHKLEDINTFSKNGKFLHYISSEEVLRIFSSRPELFFDGSIFDEKYAEYPELGKIAGDQIRMRLRDQFDACLTELAYYLEENQQDSILTQRVALSLKFLQGKLSA